MTALPPSASPCPEGLRHATRDAELPKGWVWTVRNRVGAVIGVATNHASAEDFAAGLVDQGGWARIKAEPDPFGDQPF
jgi:hypothetical protein